MRCFLIAGHGNGDPGAIGILGHKEADLTRELVSQISEYTGFDHLSFDVNAYTDTDKALKAVPGNIDLVVEVHFNASINAGARGTEIWTPLTYMDLYKDVNVMPELCAKIAAVIGTTNRGMKQANFKVISRFAARGIPAILIEVCFITSMQDFDKYRPNKVATTIGDVLMDRPVEPWYSDYAKLCDELGIITGKRYSDYVTRAEMTKIIYKILEVMGYEKKT